MLHSVLEIKIFFFLDVASFLRFCDKEGHLEHRDNKTKYAM